MSPTRTILIKRYANRKLYNTESGCYIRLQDIIPLINEGFEVCVVDNKTGGDITKDMLNRCLAYLNLSPVICREIIYANS